jgi:hypothetical protein
MEQQDKVYRKPGVALDHEILDKVISAWDTSKEQGNTCDVSYKFSFDQFEI